MIKAFLGFFTKLFGFGEKIAENKGERQKHMTPKWIQKGINGAAVLKNKLVRKKRNWLKRQERREKRNK